MFNGRALLDSEIIGLLFLFCFFVYTAINTKKRCIYLWLTAIILDLIPLFFNFFSNSFFIKPVFSLVFNLFPVLSCLLIAAGIRILYDRKIHFRFFLPFLGISFWQITNFLYFDGFSILPQLAGKASYQIVSAFLLFIYGRKNRQLDFYLGFSFLLNSLINAVFLFDFMSAVIVEILQASHIILSMFNKSGLLHIFLKMNRDVFKSGFIENRGDPEGNNLFLEYQDDIIINLDPEGNILFTNDSFKETIVSDSSNYIGKSFSVFIHSESRGAFYRMLGELYDNPQKTYFSGSLKTGKGWRWYSWSCHAIRDNQGNLSSVVVVGRDTTDQKKRDEAMQIVLELSFWAMDANDNDLVRLFLHKSCLLTNSHSATLVIPDHGRTSFVQYQYKRDGDIYYKQEMGIASLSSKMEEALFCKTAIINESDDLEKTYLIIPLFEGERVAALISVEMKDFPYEKFDIDNLSLVSQTIVNLVLRIEAENVKTQREKRLLDFFSHSPIGLFILDCQFRFIDANDKFISSLGSTQKTIQGKSLKETAPDISAIWLPYLEQILNTEEEILDAEVSFFNKTADRIDVYSVSFYPLFDSDSCLNGIAGVMLDISPRKNAEHERDEIEKQLHFAQKKEALGTLASGVAHDFNNILGGIRGYVEMAMERAEDTISAKMMNQVITGIDRAGDLVNRILSFSRSKETEKQAVDMLAVVREVKNLIDPSLPAAALIRIEYSEESYIVKADSTQMHQILMNLCTNAMLSLEGKKGIITIKLSHRVITPENVGLAVPGVYIVTEVEDTGCGIPGELIERIFDPYFTTRESGRGSGLGLSVVQGIIKNHAGFLELNSVEGSGSVFRVFLPASLDKSIPKKLDHESILTGGDERILLVDDDPSFLLMFETMLQSLGYTVYSFISGEEALQFLEPSPDKIDCVISDYTMPNMDGVSFLSRIRKLNPSLPVILCSGFSDELDLKNSELNGIVSILNKPFSKKELSLTVRKALGVSSGVPKKDLPL